MSSFYTVHKILERELREEGEVVDVGEWQAIRGDIPQARTIELQDVHFSIPIGPTREALQDEISPNLPWAEDHFLERVSGEPLNPGEQYKNWPWYKGNVERHQTQELQKFSHTYMERYWPKWANGGHDPTGDGEFASHPHEGIRYEYGDLQDVVSLLSRSPYTRQAYLPVWFPEDTGATHGERVPCSLGYHFLLREGKLNVYYFIRSCDFFRHFRDDVYLTARLGQWVLEQVQDACYSDEDWGDDYGPFNDVNMGNLIMQISSLHIFEAERARLKTD